MGANFSVSGNANYTMLSGFTPYGITAYPPPGENAIAVPVGDTFAILGTEMRPQSITHGEIMLRSSGNGYIKIGADGTVTINGATISPGGRVTSR
ncbi:MAG: phage baseplate assembly protein [Oscillospiraceae bacterium]|nr:phage baseplate assembly protein [Oscillospiraceae bacterium]